ncbi:MAG: sulfatase-like hydrolase/transferase [Salinivirgaceae bacterium]|jgi:phosphoglycerol transferase MdoB-like AlkP superfamily enzyme|nr:sulfatase-like hydrolase/transferase [Salinivirgaceae bacterium]
MNKRLIYFLKYALYWLLFFVFIRILFLAYNSSHTAKLPFTEILFVFLHGLKLDISMTGYILMALLLLSAGLIFVKQNITIRIQRIYTLIFLILFTVISVVDIELYRNWGFRIDSTILLYIKTPKESLASTPVWLTLVLVITVVAFVWTWYYLYKKFVEKNIKELPSVKWFWSIVFVLLSGSMIIPIRGGVGIAPINQGTVFFSQYQFANHASLNALWNFGNSLTTMNQKQTIHFMDDKKAGDIVANLLQQAEKEEPLKLIGDKPNILIIILESFNNGVIEALGGIKGAAPNLNKIAQEGVLFSNFFANGDRSDKGIVSILSGYPAQPTTSIIKFTSKAEKLPHLSKTLATKGYSSGFYYGGEINFANMNSYFVSGGYQHTVTLKDFSSSDLNSKWGAHDHIVFQRLFNDIEKMKSPFFRAMFTLSSHEPYDVPHKSSFNESNDEAKYLNSIHYTDSCIGDFISKAKQTDWWNNTWIIFVADHGNRWPGNISYSALEKFKIPMIWTGGSVLHDTIIEVALSQADIPLMIANQINADGSEYKFSKDIFVGQNPFAFYCFNNGFGFLKDSSGFIWDNTAGKPIKEHQLTTNCLEEGKAMMQVLLNDFNSK